MAPDQAEIGSRAASPQALAETPARSRRARAEFRQDDRSQHADQGGGRDRAARVARPEPRVLHKRPAKRDAATGSNSTKAAGARVPDPIACGPISRSPAAWTARERR